MILLSAFRGEGGASGNLFRRPILRRGSGFFFASRFSADETFTRRTE